MALETHLPNAANNTVVPILGVLQQALIERVAIANIPGNVDGLLAFHITGNDSSFALAWDVNCATERWLTENRERIAHFPVLAAVGYALHHFAPTAPALLRNVFAEGLASLHHRDPFPEDRISFTYQPGTFLGIALGTITLGEQGSSYRIWLTNVLADLQRGTPTPYHKLIYSYIHYQLTTEIMLVDDVRPYMNVEQVSLLEWGIRHQAFRLIDPRVDLSRLQESVLRLALVTEVSNLDPPRAAVIWSAVQASLIRSVEDLVLSRSHVAAVLRRFADAMRRWRWDDATRVRRPIQWPVDSEREVQDIVWLILRSVFDDVVDEETLPKLGHSTYRADFGIPSLKLLVEVKFARKAVDFKAYEKEVMEDTIGYLLQTGERYDRILVFIYDHSASVQEHGLTIAALRKLPQIEDVVIVSRPSQLPTDRAIESD